MPRDSHNQRQMRMRIAQAAARLMAEDGIDDYGLAKRKAARQTGAPDTRNLPDNEEIEQALKEYQQLYQAGEQAERLEELRVAALRTMRRLAAFDPHLVGPVLSGSAGRYSDIDLHLFTDDPKELEMFLINNRIVFKPREGRFTVAGETRVVPVYELSSDDEAGTRLTVFSRRDSRHSIRSSQDSRPIERVRAPWLEQTLSPNADRTAP